MFSLIVTQDSVVFPWFKEGRYVTKTCIDNSLFSLQHTVKYPLGEVSHNSYLTMSKMLTTNYANNIIATAI